MRINPLDTMYALDDLMAVCQYQPDAIVVPKATKEVIIAADIILNILELRFGLLPQSVGMVALVETALGVDSISAIAGASPRLIAVQFGAEDYTKDMEIVRSVASGEIVHSRNRLAIACRAYGIDCIDTPYLDFKDSEGYIRDTEYVKAIGMTGRCLIHPSLIESTNRIFSPSSDEIEEANEIVTAYQEAVEKGMGAVALNGKMIDLPVYQRALGILEKMRR